MAEHPFNDLEELDLRVGIASLRRLGYFTVAAQVEAVLDEQLRARTFRENQP